MAEAKDKKEIDKVAELEAQLKASQEENAAILERNEDLKKREKLALKATISKKTLVEVEGKQYEILANGIIGGLKDKREITKEELKKPENIEIVKSMIAKGSGLIRPI
jgi:hypothetical protein